MLLKITKKIIRENALNKFNPGLSANRPSNNWALNKIKIERSVKILGVHFTYVIRAKQKLNINELISSIQLKATNLEVEGSDYHRENSNCQNLYYTYLLISHEFDIIDKEFVKEDNIIIFDSVYLERKG